MQWRGRKAHKKARKRAKKPHRVMAARSDTKLPTTSSWKSGFVSAGYPILERARQREKMLSVDSTTCDATHEKTHVQLRMHQCSSREAS